MSGWPEGCWQGYSVRQAYPIRGDQAAQGGADPQSDTGAYAKKICKYNLTDGITLLYIIHTQEISMTKTQISIGDKVAYSAKFLRSIGEVTGTLAHGRGVVTAIKKYGDVSLAVIVWDCYAPERVNVSNLAKVGTAQMNAN
jgi:hypothetical protein